MQRYAQAAVHGEEAPGPGLEQLHGADDGAVHLQRHDQRRVDGAGGRDGALVALVDAVGEHHGPAGDGLPGERGGDLRAGPVVVGPDAHEAQDVLGVGDRHPAHPGLVLDDGRDLGGHARPEAPAHEPQGPPGHPRAAAEEAAATRSGPAAGGSARPSAGPRPPG